MIVTDELVATMLPVIEFVLTDAVNNSDPSVKLSDNGVTSNDPALLVIVNDPDVAEKSTLLEVTLLTVQ